MKYCKEDASNMACVHRTLKYTCIQIYIQYKHIRTWNYCIYIAYQPEKVTNVHVYTQHVYTQQHYTLGVSAVLVCISQECPWRVRLPSLAHTPH